MIRLLTSAISEYAKSVFLCRLGFMESLQLAQLKRYEVLPSHLRRGVHAVSMMSWLGLDFLDEGSCGSLVQPYKRLKIGESPASNVEPTYGGSPFSFAFSSQAKIYVVVVLT